MVMSGGASTGSHPATPVAGAGPAAEASHVAGPPDQPRGWPRPATVLTPPAGGVAEAPPSGGPRRRGANWAKAATVAGLSTGLLVVIVVVGNLIQGWLAPGPLPEPAPPHQVVYTITTAGTANEPIDVSYMSADGTVVADQMLGHAQFWSKEITTEPGQTLLMVEGSGISTDLDFRMTCAITVDGVPVGSQTQPFHCDVLVDLTTVDLDQPTASPSGPATAGPPAPSRSPTFASPAPEPPACRYVPRGEAERIVSAQVADGSYKPVHSVSGDEQRCSYRFDQNGLRVRFTWIPGGQADGFPYAEVPGLGVPAYWLELVNFGELQVQLPEGVFEVGVDVELPLVPDVRQELAIEIFEAARPHLPGG